MPEADAADESTPPPQLRILHLEDRADDAILVAAALRRDGIDADIRLATNRPTFLAELERGDIDLILSDYRLPGFDGLAALEIAARLLPTVPCILVSGTIGEEAAIESLRSGATDYVLKDRLNRLGPAVLRAIQEARERRTRVEAEEALRREQHFLRGLLESLQTSIVACDAEGTITLFNRAARELHGVAALPSSSSERLSLFKLFESGGTVPLAREEMPLLRALRGERFRDLEMAIEPLGKSRRMLLVSGQPISDENGRSLGAVIAQRDVTEQRRMADQLRQSHRMEAVGQLAGGVAHDFNNLLTVILGYCQILATSLPVESSARLELAEIKGAAERAAELTRQLLAFSRKQVLQPVVLDINEVLGKTETLLRRLIGTDIALVAEPETGLLRVKADPGQIEQVLLNLAVNARDAMPGGGELRFRTTGVLLGADRPPTQIAELPPGPYVLLAVSDTGTGMDAATRARIFEPFFTTKDAGKGTGLGLATVHGIVKQSGGHIEVQSVPGRGTTFRVFLPALESMADTAPEPAHPPARLRGSESILLVEDDAAVRKVLADTLRSIGYTVHDAADGAEALRLRGRPGVQVDLLVTDVVMPRMSGVELVKTLHQSWPDMPVLYVSGHTDHTAIHEGARAARIAFLQKPFTLDGLNQKVREVLDGAGGGSLRTSQ